MKYLCSLKLFVSMVFLSSPGCPQSPLCFFFPCFYLWCSAHSPLWCLLFVCQGLDLPYAWSPQFMQRNFVLMQSSPLALPSPDCSKMNAVATRFSCFTHYSLLSRRRALQTIRLKGRCGEKLRKYGNARYRWELSIQGLPHWDHIPPAVYEAEVFTCSNCHVFVLINHWISATKGSCNLTAAWGARVVVSSRTGDARKAFHIEQNDFH